MTKELCHEGTKVTKVTKIRRLMMMRVSVSLAAAVAAFTLTACVRVKEPAVSPTVVPGATLWVAPGNLQSRDLL